MRLSEAMRKNPEEPEVTVFRNFASDLIARQHQLDISYYGDQFLRDLFLMAVYIPHINFSP